MTCLTSQSSFSDHLSTLFESHPLPRSPFHIIYFPLSLASATVNRTPIPRLFFYVSLRSVLCSYLLQPTAHAMTRADISTIVLYHNFFVVFEVRIQVIFVFLALCNVSCHDCPILFSFFLQHGESLASRLPYVFARLTHVRMFLVTPSMHWYGTQINL